MAEEERVEQEQPDTTESQVETPLTVAGDVIKPLEESPREFDFWEDLKDSMPPWINEVVGFALIVFGILSFISLFIASEALVAVAWADMLIKLFGDGAVFVGVALFLFGVILWLPKTGLRLRFSSARMLAVEIAFLSLLALLHLGNSESELRALARAGQGGGLIGWGLSYPFFWILGRPAAVVFFLLIITVCGVIIIGLRRRHIIAALSRFGIQLQDYSDGTRLRTMDSEDEDSLSLYRRMAESPAYRTQIMRIRPHPENLPEEVRETREAAVGSESSVERVHGAKKPRIDIVVEGASADAPNGMSADGMPPETESQSKSSSENHESMQQSALWANTLPAINCLTHIDLIAPDEEEINHNAMLIQNTLLEFDLETIVIDVQVGPAVTRYALLPHKEDGTERIRMNKIASYAKDLSLALSAKRLRMETPVPGTNFMGIEVPNKEPGIVALRNVIESEAYLEARRNSGAQLLIPLGSDVMGEAISLDLAQMPHLLIAGTTGSGKSVCMAAIATSLLMQYSPDQLQLIMLDPKMVELSRFSEIPHLRGQVEIDHDRIIGVLRWCTREMRRRYKSLQAQGVRNIKMYNERQTAQGVDGEPMPYLVIMIDEIGDLMLSNPDETEQSVTQLAQMARAVGMHMVVATQRPSVDVITGKIKANFPARIAFSVASGSDSRVILDRTGAEDLLGQGDMLFMSPDAAGPQRIQGCFVSEDDVRDVVQHWREAHAQLAEAGAVPSDNTSPWEALVSRRQILLDTDPMLEDALNAIVEAGEASASLIQRKLGLGYPRAARIMDLLEELGAIGPDMGGGRSREVLIPAGQDPFEYVLERHATNKAQS